MAKLRLVKERRRETSEHEQDLRGLGETSLLSNEYPWVYLAVTSPKEINQKICEAFGLEAKESSDSTSTILYHDGKVQNHKEKSLKLFFASVAMMKKAPTTSTHLGQLSVLREKLQGKGLAEIDEQTTEEFQSWDQKSGELLLADPILLYLEQSGIKASKNTLNCFELDEVLSEFEQTLTNKSKGVKSEAS